MRRNKHDRNKLDNEWTLVPATREEIEALRRKCRRLVSTRAIISAGAAALPIPGVDIVMDIGLLTRLIDDINAEFGLSAAQIERLQPKAKLMVYQAVTGIGGTLVGKFVTRQLVLQLLQRSGAKILAKQSARLVPIAGHLASAAMGYAAFRAIGEQHVAACVAIAEELLELDAIPAS